MVHQHKTKWLPSDLVEKESLLPGMKTVCLHFQESKDFLKGLALSLP